MQTKIKDETVHIYPLSKQKQTQFSSSINTSQTQFFYRRHVFTKLEMCSQLKNIPFFDSHALFQHNPHNSVG